MRTGHISSERKTVLITLTRMIRETIAKFIYDG